MKHVIRFQIIKLKSYVFEAKAMNDDSDDSDDNDNNGSNGHSTNLCCCANDDTNDDPHVHNT